MKKTLLIAASIFATTTLHAVDQNKQMDRAADAAQDGFKEYSAQYADWNYGPQELAEQALSDLNETIREQKEFVAANPNDSAASDKLEELKDARNNARANYLGGKFQETIDSAWGFLKDVGNTISDTTGKGVEKAGENVETVASSL